MSAAPPTGDLRRVRRVLGQVSAGQGRFLAGAVALLALEAVTAVFEPYPLGFLVDLLRGDRGPLGWATALAGGRLSPRLATVAVVSVAIVVIAMVNSLADSLAEICLARGGRMLGFNLRVTLYSHLQRLSLAFHNRSRTGDVLLRVTSDVTALEEFVTASVGDLAGSVLVLAGTLTFLFARSWQTALVAVAIVPVLSLVSNHFSRRIKAAARQQRAREGELASAAQEMLTSIGVVQSYGRGGHDLERFARQSRQTMAVALLTARLEASFSWVVKVLEALATAVIVWVGLWLIQRSAITVGTLIMFVILIQNMFKPTRKIIKEWGTIGKVLASVDRIGDLLDRRPTVGDEPDAVVAGPLQGYVELRHVSFAYQPDPADRAGADVRDSRPKLALDDVSFSIRPGQVLALVGPSGAGKSTVAQLLPRLYDPHVGQVLVDHQDVRRFTVDSLRSQISLVLQETILFRGTVADNIAYGRPGATREEVVEAAIRANAHEFIVEMPEGYDTELTERAANLSGGQRQRLAIARAFVRNTPILILDEPTTGLDTESTDSVVRGLRTLMQGKTTIVISHDLSLVRGADQIVMLGDGRIAEVGTPESLLAAGGPYAELHARQVDVAAPGEATGPESPEAGPVHPPEPVAAEDFGAALAGTVPQPAPAVAFRAVVAGSDRSDGSGGAGGDGRAGGRPGSAPEGLAPAAPGVEGGLAPAAPGGNGGGRGASPRRPGSPAGGLDPRASPELDRELPGLRSALDAGEMAGRLQAALFGEGPWAVEGCTPGKVTYLAETCCSLRYTLRVRHGGTGERRDQIVLAKVFPDLPAGVAYGRDRLEPLVRGTRAHPALAPFARPVAMVDELHLVAHAFPIDPELPTLSAATDPRRMARVLAEVLPEAADGRFLVEGCGVQLFHYARRHRCVLRYEISGHTAAGGAPRRRLVFAKVVDSEPGGLAPAVLAALARRLEEGASAYPFAVPRSLGFRPELRLSLLDAVPGTPQVRALLRWGVMGASAPGSLSLEEAVGACGGIAAAVHGSGISLGRPHTLADEVAALRWELSVGRRLTPLLGRRLEEALAHVEERAGRTPVMPLVLNHGDYTHAQVLFDGPRPGLVDFDTVCQAEPALDLGQFLAHLRVARSRAAHAEALAGPEELARLFLAGYREAGGAGADEELLAARVRAYEVVSLVRMALHSCQQLKGDRLAAVVAALDDEVLDLHVAHG